jgi:hypothetical protein
MDEARRKVETPPALRPVQGVKRREVEIIEVDLAASEGVEAVGRDRFAGRRPSSRPALFRGQVARRIAPGSSRKMKSPCKRAASAQLSLGTPGLRSRGYSRDRSVAQMALVYGALSLSDRPRVSMKDTIGALIRPTASVCYLRNPGGST